MLVTATCTYKSWDSSRCVFYYPGDVCQIDHECQLVTLRTNKQWNFQFDRTMKGTGLMPALGGWVCKDCGEAFDTLNAIGSHTREKHKEEFIVEESPEEVPEELPFACEQCSKRFKDNRALVGHVRWAHKKVAETESVPA